MKIHSVEAELFHAYIFWVLNMMHLMPEDGQNNQNM